MNLEIIIIALLFISSIILLFNNLRAGIFVLLLISMFLHKELFSIYRWDVLPVRIFMIAFVAFSFYRLLFWFLKKRNWQEIKSVVMHPFVLSLLLLWLVRAISLVNTLNTQASLFMLGFFTTIVVLAIHLFLFFQDKSDDVWKYLKTYYLIVFSFVLFAVVQFILNIKFGWIYGSLWNVPGHWPRVGALFWDVNHFGGLLAAVLPLGASLFFTSPGWKKKLGYLLSLIITLVILVLTNSRTAWIGFGAGALIFVTVLMFRWIKARGLLIVFSVLLILAIPTYFELNDKSSPLRAVVKQYFHYRIDSFNSHFYLLKGASEIYEQYPVLGGGYGSFYEHFIKTDIADNFLLHDPVALNSRIPAHTIWGEVLAETGYIGTLAFILFLTVGLLPLLYLALTKKDKKEYFPALGLFSGMVGWLISGTFYSYNAEFFWIIFILGFLYGVNTVGKDKFEAVFGWLMKNKGLGLALIIVLSMVLLFINLGKNHLLPWDEAIYSQIAKNMVEKEEYIVMNWVPGKIWYEKPPLGIWLIAASYNLFGISEFSSRLPSALLGLGTIIFVYLLAKKLGGKLTAYISALSLLTTFNFLYYSRASMLDVTVTFFITGALYFYWLFKEEGYKHAYILAGVFTGLAVMTKGVVGFIPLGVIGLFELYLVISRNRKFTFRWVLELSGYLFVSALVFLPWHLEMYRRFGPAFIENYIGYHVLDRATSAIEDKGAPWWYYFVVIKVSMRIWFVVLIPAVIYLVTRLLKNDKKAVFLSIWSVVVFVLFTTSISKLKWYIVPFYPAASLVVALFTTWVLAKVSRYLNHINILRFIFILIVTTFSLTYLFIERELVYESDLTGSQAVLLQKKDELFGTEDTVYADRIDLPLVLYYSDSPYEITDFTPLKTKILDVSKGDRKGVLYFITKESRFHTLKRDFEELQIVEQNKEWILGIWSASYNYNSQKMELEPVNNAE